LHQRAAGNNYTEYVSLKAACTGSRHQALKIAKSMFLPGRETDKKSQQTIVTCHWTPMNMKKTSYYFQRRRLGTCHVEHNIQGIMQVSPIQEDNKNTN
jgi:hypothetical protein